MQGTCTRTCNRIKQRYNLGRYNVIKSQTLKLSGINNYYTVMEGYQKGMAIYIPYKWIYWRVEYLAICLKNSVGVILIWRNGR